MVPSAQEEKEKRRLEQLERKKETQRLLEEEASKLKGGKAPRPAAPGKVTRAQIEETLRRDQAHKDGPEPGRLQAQGYGVWARVGASVGAPRVSSS